MIKSEEMMAARDPEVSQAMWRMLHSDFEHWLIFVLGNMTPGMTNLWVLRNSLRLINHPETSHMGVL